MAVQGPRDAPGAAGATAGRGRRRLVRSADALGAADAGRERSRPVRSAVLARLLPPHPRRRRLPQRRRHRRLLPDRGPAPPPQRLARRRAIRSATLVAGCRALGMRVVARTDPHAARDDVRAAHPDWIAVDADGQPRRHWANPELWVTCALGPYNFEFMTRCTARSSRRYQRRRHLHQPLGAAGRRVLLRALPAATSARRPGSICRARPMPRDPARRAYRRVAQGAADRAVEALGRRRPRGESRRALHPERPARSRRPPASWRPSSSPTTRRAAG